MSHIQPHSMIANFTVAPMHQCNTAVLKTFQHIFQNIFPNQIMPNLLFLVTYLADFWQKNKVEKNIGARGNHLPHCIILDIAAIDLNPSVPEIFILAWFQSCPKLGVLKFAQRLRETQSKQSLKDFGNPMGHRSTFTKYNAQM